MKRSGIITLTTDFGLRDPYVGIIKGVILSINPLAKIIDITHQIRPGRIFEAAAVLTEAYTFFPMGTVHVVVVDPGVGSHRRPILVSTEAHFMVGPDNGVLWPIVEIHQPAEIIHLTESEYFLPRVSHTFHGRDIFAPVAAHLTKGISPLKMGHLLENPRRLEFPAPREGKTALSGQVIRVDRFGNLITNIRQTDLERFLKKNSPVIRIGDLTVKRMCATYSAAPEGEALALIGSSGRLEVAVNLGRACDRTGLEAENTVGMNIVITKRKRG